ncbi:hypothetical protein Tco_1380991 [Tanacetum coccineum]
MTEMYLAFVKEPFEIKLGACGMVVPNAAKTKIFNPEINASLPRNQCVGICILGDQIMKGYLNDLEATKRMIVAPAGLDVLLLTHPEVCASVVVSSKPITDSKPYVITKKDVHFDSNGLSSTRVDNTAKTRRP